MQDNHPSLVVLGIEEIRRSKSEADIIGLIAAGATKKCLPPDAKSKKHLMSKRKTVMDMAGPVKVPPPEEEPLFVSDDSIKPARWSLGSLIKSIVRPRDSSGKKKTEKKCEKRGSDRSDRSDKSEKKGSEKSSKKVSQKSEKRDSDKSSKDSKSLKSESRTSDPLKFKKRRSLPVKKSEREVPLDLFGGESKDDIDEELERVIASGLPKSRKPSLGGDEEEEPITRTRSETDITTAGSAMKQRTLEIEAERRKRKSLDKRADLNFPRKSRPAVLVTVGTPPGTSTAPCPSWPASPSNEFEIKVDIQRLARSKSSS